jgi:hypothetical protein
MGDIRDVLYRGNENTQGRSSRLCLNADAE